MNKYPILFVSLGPGDPELMTLKAYKALQKSDRIYYPTTMLQASEKRSRAETIMMANEIDPTKFTPYHLPMEKNREKAQKVYGDVAEQCINDYKKGLSVSIVAEGDASFYSSTHYISDIIQKENLPIEYIAGVPAFIAAGARSTLQIAAQENELLIIPGTATLEKLNEAFERTRSVLIMKLSRCEVLVKEILSNDKTLSVYYFENIGTDIEYITTNKDEIVQRKFPYFSMIWLRCKTNDQPAR